jgi:multiple sugar transport system permease protein
MGNGIKGSIFIYIFRQSFRGLPADLEEAAYIDGCGFLRTFAVIMAPSAAGAFLVTLILSLIWHWNDITYVPMFFPKLETLPIALESIDLSGIAWDFNDMFVVQRAGALLMILPVLLIFLVLQKYFIRSIATTGIK